MSEPGPASAWVVLKFGGTSVSSGKNWSNVARIVRQRRAAGPRVLLVHSAIAGITDRLEQLLTAALGGSYQEALDAIVARHRLLATELQIPPGASLEHQFEELRELASGIAMVGEVTDRARARVMAAGELMATDLGARYLAAQGIDTSWADARTMLRAEPRHGLNLKASVLSATCGYAPDAGLRARLEALAPVVLTQGFIASDDEGHTVLLGRGGSDTSAAYLAAKIGASRLEIWTDVPGMFSANPRSTPNARLLRALSYDEAQEIATAGAKVLHPRCIMPARQYGIPLYILATQAPDVEGTVLTETPAGADAAQVKAVCIKKGITLVSMESPGMWHQVGFVADAFQVFKNHGLSVDLISTSETSVTVSLDPQANTLDRTILDQFVTDLGRLCRVEVIGPCASVSLVGRNIRAILHQLGDAFALFEEHKVYLVTQAANDLNFTFVVDEDQGDRLVDQLHELLVRPIRGDQVLGPTWEQLFAPPEAPSKAGTAWWRTRQRELLRLLADRECAYVYDRNTVLQRARELRALRSLDRVLYAMKANANVEVLRTVREAGLALECVSRGEVELALREFPQIDRRQILFTPNFAPIDEYQWAFSQGVIVTADNAQLLQAWPEVFRGRELFLRVDPGFGRGHHEHVRTGGAYSKFGISAEQLPQVAELARRNATRITGLHAHIGSGIFDAGSWAQTAASLAALRKHFPEVRVIDVGGGLGVPERGGWQALNLEALDAALGAVRAGIGPVEIWLEPGRYLVAEAGVLIARVTQTKRKGEVRYVGIATGMNSLIRPALYGAHHEVHNLSHIDAAATELVNVVGPICESADYLAHDRPLPPTEPGDVLLIATAGAYGHAMSSHYNLRAPATEIVI